MITMSSTKKVLFFICVLEIIFNMPVGSESVSSAIITEDKGNCSCGGFASATPDTSSTPLLSQSPGLVVECDESGESKCKSLCLALAAATKAKGPEILCNRIVNADELKLSAFYKVCDKPWTYADMTADEPLCCEDTKVKTCQSTETATSNFPADSKAL